MKKFLIILLILILLPVLAVGIFILTFDLNRYRDFTEKKLSEAFNYPVSIGSMETKLSLVPTIQVSNVKIMTQDKKDILTIPQMEATVEIAPLLKKQVNVQKISVSMLTMDLTQLDKKAEKENTKKEAKSQATSKASGTNTDLSKLIWVKDFQVGKLHITYPLKDKKDTLIVENFTLKDMSNFSFKINYLRNDFNVSGSFGNITKLLQNITLLPIKLDIKNGTTLLTCNGQIKDIKKMEDIRLDFNLTAAKLSDIFKIFDIKSNFNFNSSVRFSAEGNLNRLNLKKIDVSLKSKELSIMGDGTLISLTTNPVLNLKLSNALTAGQVAQQLGLNAFEMTEQIKFEKSKLSVNNIKYLANKSDINGTINLDFVKKPLDINFDLKSAYLSLDDILYPQRPNKPNTSYNAPQKNKKIIPNIQLPWELLNTFNLNGQIQVANLDLSNNMDEYFSIDMHPVLKDGVLTTPIQMRFLTGTLNNAILLDQKTKSIQLKSEGKNLSLDKVKEVNKEIKNATLNSEISLQTSGSSTKELLVNSKGSITLEILNGVITNKWFNTLAKSFAPQKKTLTTTETQTNLLCGVVNLPINNGILTSQDKVVLQTDVLNIILNGNINLNNETLNLTMVPTLPTINDKHNLTDLMQIIQLKGPWTEPQISVNTQKVISDLLNLSLGKVLGNKTGKAQSVSKTALCQKALGHELSSVKKVVNTTKTPPQNMEKAEEKKDIKQQLFNSLSQVLKKQGA